ncbi:hypothetical protein JTB14_022330 [Gonioctena quinquepunctata]|nr:hypothetical protein JTB14_022330 [Gonioctena quinquepunctata]
MTVCLESLNCEEYLINPQILRKLIDKMPLNLRMNWGIYVKSQQKKVGYIKDFSLWLEKFTQFISYMQLSTDKNTESVLTTNSGGKSRFCSFCKKSDHYQLIICEKFEKADVASRWKFVVDKKLCFCCLFGNHRTSYCKKKQLGNINGCKSKHNILFHNPDNISQNSHENTLSREMNYHARHLKSTDNTVLLKIVPDTLEGPNGTIETCALCDEASTITIIEKEIANVLGCAGEKEPLTMK